MEGAKRIRCLSPAEAEKAAEAYYFITVMSDTVQNMPTPAAIQRNTSTWKHVHALTNWKPEK